MRRVRPLPADIAELTGTPLRVSDLAKLTGWSKGTLPVLADHRMIDFRALRKEWPCGSPGSQKVRSSAS
jgi:hypothetical protein